MPHSVCSLWPRFKYHLAIPADHSSFSAIWVAIFDLARPEVGGTRRIAYAREFVQLGLRDWDYSKSSLLRLEPWRVRPHSVPSLTYKERRRQCIINVFQAIMTKPNLCLGFRGEPAAAAADELKRFHCDGHLCSKYLYLWG